MSSSWTLTCLNCGPMKFIEAKCNVLYLGQNRIPGINQYRLGDGMLYLEYCIQAWSALCVKDMRVVMCRGRLQK